jgi:hypothetical protein
MLTTASAFIPRLSKAASTQSGSKVPEISNIKRPSLPVTRAGMPSVIFPSIMSLCTAALKSPSWGVEADHTTLPFSINAILRLVDPIFIPKDFEP